MLTYITRFSPLANGPLRSVSGVDSLQGGTIKGSINLPAQSLYPTIPYLYNLFSAAGVKTIVWYCGKMPLQLLLRPRNVEAWPGSSVGRGGRAAGWFQDYIKDQGGEGVMESSTLEGGIKGWVAAGEDYVTLVDGYESSAWTS